jgi:hypothetical protein
MDSDHQPDREGFEAAGEWTGRGIHRGEVSRELEILPGSAFISSQARFRQACRRASSWQT